MDFVYLFFSFHHVSLPLPTTEEIEKKKYVPSIFVSPPIAGQLFRVEGAGHQNANESHPGQDASVTKIHDSWVSGEVE